MNNLLQISIFLIIVLLSSIIPNLTKASEEDIFSSMRNAINDTAKTEKLEDTKVDNVIKKSFDSKVPEAAKKYIDASEISPENLFEAQKILQESTYSRPIKYNFQKEGWAMTTLMFGSSAGDVENQIKRIIENGSMDSDPKNIVVKVNSSPIPSIETTLEDLNADKRKRQTDYLKLLERSKETGEYVTIPNFLKSQSKDKIKPVPVDSQITIKLSLGMLASVKTVDELAAQIFKALAQQNPKVYGYKEDKRFTKNQETLAILGQIFGDYSEENFERRRMELLRKESRKDRFSNPEMNPELQRLVRNRAHQQQMWSELATMERLLEAKYNIWSLYNYNQRVSRWIQDVFIASKIHKPALSSVSYDRGQAKRWDVNFKEIKDRTLSYRQQILYMYVAHLQKQDRGGENLNLEDTQFGIRMKAAQLRMKLFTNSFFSGIAFQSATTIAGLGLTVSAFLNPQFFYTGFAAIQNSIGEIDNSLKISETYGSLSTKVVNWKAEWIDGTYLGSSISKSFQENIFNFESLILLGTTTIATYLVIKKAPFILQSFSDKKKEKEMEKIKEREAKLASRNEQFDSLANEKNASNKIMKKSNSILRDVSDTFGFFKNRTSKKENSKVSIILNKLGYSLNKKLNYISKKDDKTGKTAFRIYLDSKYVKAKTAARTANQLKNDTKDAMIQTSKETALWSSVQLKKGYKKSIFLLSKTPAAAGVALVGVGTGLSFIGIVVPISVAKAIHRGTVKSHRAVVQLSQTLSALNKKRIVDNKKKKLKKMALRNRKNRQFKKIEKQFKLVTDTTNDIQFSDFSPLWEDIAETFYKNNFYLKPKQYKNLLLNLQILVLSWEKLLEHKTPSISEYIDLRLILELVAISPLKAYQREEYKNPLSEAYRINKISIQLLKYNHKFFSLFSKFSSIEEKLDYRYRRTLNFNGNDTYRELKNSSVVLKLFSLYYAENIHFGERADFLYQLNHFPSTRYFIRNSSFYKDFPEMIRLSKTWHSLKHQDKEKLIELLAKNDFFNYDLNRVHLNELVFDRFSRTLINGFTELLQDSRTSKKNLARLAVFLVEQNQFLKNPKSSEYKGHNAFKRELKKSKIMSDFSPSTISSLQYDFYQKFIRFTSLEKLNTLNIIKETSTFFINNGHYTKEFMHQISQAKKDIVKRHGDSSANINELYNSLEKYSNENSLEITDFKSQLLEYVLVNSRLIQNQTDVDFYLKMDAFWPEKVEGLSTTPIERPLMEMMENQRKRMKSSNVAFSYDPSLSEKIHRILIDTLKKSNSYPTATDFHANFKLWDSLSDRGVSTLTDELLSQLLKNAKPRQLSMLKKYTVKTAKVFDQSIQDSFAFQEIYESNIYQDLIRKKDINIDKRNEEILKVVTFAQEKFQNIGISYVNFLETLSLKISASENEAAFIHDLKVKPLIYKLENKADSSSAGNDDRIKMFGKILPYIKTWAGKNQSKFLLYLRGSLDEKDFPFIKKQFPVYGPGRIRRMFQALPLEAAMPLIDLYLADTLLLKGSVNKGEAKKLVETIINDTGDKEARKYAHQLVTALLAGIEGAKNKPFQRSVLSALIAMRSDVQSSVGETLKVILEQFPGVGPKIAQFLVPTGKLPDEVNEVLRKAQDNTLPPRLNEMYQDASEMLGGAKVPFRILRSLGSGSMKYTYLAEEKKSRDKLVMQVFRHDIQNNSALYINVLRETIKHLIKTDGEQWTFLEVIVEGAIHAVSSEKRYTRESAKNQIAKNRIYKNFSDNLFVIEVPVQSQIKDRFLSAKFAQGKSFFELSNKSKVLAGRKIMEMEESILFADKDIIWYDTDRHAGNYLIVEPSDKNSSKHAIFPIDFGQLTFIKRAHRENIIKLFSIAKIASLYGNSPWVAKQVSSVLGLNANESSRLNSKLNTFFPTPKSFSIEEKNSVLAYFNLLASINSSTKKNRNDENFKNSKLSFTYSDFVRAIIQFNQYHNEIHKISPETVHLDSYSTPLTKLESLVKEQLVNDLKTYKPGIKQSLMQITANSLLWLKAKWKGKKFEKFNFNLTMNQIDSFSKMNSSSSSKNELKQFEGKSIKEINESELMGKILKLEALEKTPIKCRGAFK